jgi:organic radical activating enzyme
MIPVQNLEWFAAHACNLSCEGCLTYSDYDYNTVIKKETLKQWFEAWNKRISPKHLAIMGGEPLINKEILDIIQITNDSWNKNYVEYFEIITNGFLLYKYPDLPKVLKETNCTLAISIHHDSDEYTQKIQEIKEITDEWVKEHGISLRLYTDNSRKEITWRLPFKNYRNGVFDPYEDNDIEGSWNNCPTGQTCWQLYDYNIYKCPLVAYLPLQKKNYGLSEKWDPYLKYVPLTPDSSDKEIIDFFNQKAEDCCGMCSSVLPEPHYKQDPIHRKKTFKIKKIAN